MDTYPMPIADLLVDAASSAILLVDAASGQFYGWECRI